MNTGFPQGWRVYSELAILLLQRIVLLVLFSALQVIHRLVVKFFRFVFKILF